MKTIFVITLLLFSSIPALGQSDSPTSEPRHHDYGWIGLLGLTGLAGLRRQKNADQERLAASGVNVKSVKV
jgi:MYXO-CTERM domain-containing protein